MRDSRRRVRGDGIGRQDGARVAPRRWQTRAQAPREHTVAFLRAYVLGSRWVGVDSWRRMRQLFQRQCRSCGFAVQVDVDLGVDIDFNMGIDTCVGISLDSRFYFVDVLTLASLSFPSA
eukprot:1562646-Pleurochrysis_carterae.AAC.1